MKLRNCTSTFCIGAVAELELQKFTKTQNMIEELKLEIKQSCFAFANVLLAAGASWKDATNYSRNDTERVPTIFRTEIGGCTISIIIGHIYCPNTWIMNCYELNIKEKTLQCVTAEAAAQLAVFHCKDKIQKLHDAFSTCI
jgi:hypothetical protein